MFGYLPPKMKCETKRNSLLLFYILQKKKKKKKKRRQDKKGVTRTVMHSFHKHS
jgi:hypothetical protein